METGVGGAESERAEETEEAKRARGRRALEGLLRRFDLEPDGDNAFDGDPGPGSRRLFGGLVAAQSLIAAGRTVERGFVHSLHAYFLRPGRHEPIRFEVDRIRDGRSFMTRRVVALQRGEAIFNLSASFALPESGIAHSEPMPETPEPDALPPLLNMRGRPWDRNSPVEFRAVDEDERDAQPGSLRRMWFRPSYTLPEDPLIHAALLVFASDRSLLSTVARGHHIPWARRRGASLDHAVWLHQPPRLDDWMLYATQSPVAMSARGWIQGAMYSRSGERIATVAQEGLIRLIDDDAPRR